MSIPCSERMMIQLTVFQVIQDRRKLDDFHFTNSISARCLEVQDEQILESWRS